jgi:tetratricopeptide (TPR) repeat protein
MAKIYRTFKDGKFDGKHSLKEVGGLSDEDIQGMLQMAWMFYNQGKLESAQVVLQGVAAIDPDNKLVWGALGALYLRQSREEEALEVLNKAIRLDPEEISNYVNRGEVLFKLGQVEASARDFNKVLEMDPESKNPAANRARLILVGLGEIMKMVRQEKKE